MSLAAEQADRQNGALDRLVNREEVLQICYWYEGEGFGKAFDSAVLRPFLKCDSRSADAALRELVAQGHLESSPAAGYRFTEQGRKEAGRLFADGFADYQKAGHGECAAGCCEEDDHSRCGDDCAFH